MKKLTLTAVATVIISIAGLITAWGTIKAAIPYAYAEDVEDLKKIVLINTKTSETIAINMKIERLDRKAEKLERKTILTPEEDEILKDYIEEIKNLEDDLDQ